MSSLEKVKKIYIIGPVGSGKSTLGKRLSQKYNLCYYELDKIVHDDLNNVKRNVDEINKLFLDIINNDSWLIEDVGRKIFEDGKKYADIIYYIDLNKYKIYYRVVKRWVKQKLRLEKFNYKPTIKGLIQMICWAHQDIVNKDEVKKELIKYGDKVIFITSRDINKLL